MTFGDIIVLFLLCLAAGVVVWEVLKILWWVVFALVLILCLPILFIFKNKSDE